MSETQANREPLKVKIIKICDTNGLDKDHIMVGEQARLALALFPPKDGWAIVVDASDKMGWFKATTSLKRTFLQSSHAGEKPNEYVEVILGKALNVQFEAKLVDPNGRTVANASCTWQIRRSTFDQENGSCSISEWSKGETNARRRLYNALGLNVQQLKANPDFTCEYLTEKDVDAHELDEEMPGAKVAGADGGGRKKDGDKAPVAASTAAPAAAPAAGETHPPAAAPQKGNKEDKPNPAKDEAKRKNLVSQIRAILDRRGIKDRSIPENDLPALRAMYKELNGKQGQPTQH